MLELLARVKGLVLDCDGVLTAEGLYYHAGGGRSLKFNAKDGQGLALLAAAEIPIGVLSGRAVDIVSARLRDIGVPNFVAWQSQNKAVDIREICKRLQISLADTAYIGDDLPDLGALLQVGIPIAVKNAAAEVLAISKIQTTHEGGKGAVREVCENILKAKNLWQGLLERYSVAARA